MSPPLRTRRGWAAQPPGGALPGPAPIVFQLGLAASPCPRHGPQSLADGFWQPPAPPCPPDGGMTALDPRLSLAPGMIWGRPLALRAAASSRASEASTAALDPGLDRQLDSGLRSPARPRPAAASSAARPPACPRGRSGAKLLPGLAPTPPGRGRSRGRKRDAARLAISRGMSRLLSGSSRGF